MRKDQEIMSNRLKLPNDVIYDTIQFVGRNELQKISTTNRYIFDASKFILYEKYKHYVNDMWIGKNSNGDEISQFFISRKIRDEFEEWILVQAAKVLPPPSILGFNFVMLCLNVDRPFFSQLKKFFKVIKHMLTEHSLSIHKHIDFCDLDRAERKRRVRFISEFAEIFDRFVAVDLMGTPIKCVSTRAILSANVLNLTFFEDERIDRSLNSIILWLHHPSTRPRFLKFPDCDYSVVVSFVTRVVQEFTHAVTIAPFIVIIFPPETRALEFQHENEKTRETLTLSPILQEGEFFDRLLLKRHSPTLDSSLYELSDQTFEFNTAKMIHVWW